LPGFVNGGIYVLRRDVRKLLDAYSGAFSLEKDFFPHAVTALHAGAYISSDFFVDIGIPTDYMKAREILPAMTKKAM
jgi:D-glycero-alpha-D-manno-heptose 1-phosphate guanylyltransferase